MAVLDMCDIHVNSAEQAKTRKLAYDQIVEYACINETPTKRDFMLNRTQAS